jgi:hypothetical protein
VSAPDFGWEHKENSGPSAVEDLEVARSGVGGDKGANMQEPQGDGGTYGVREPRRSSSEQAGNEAGPYRGGVVEHRVPIGDSLQGDSGRE